jgi:hypothetical protein
VEPVGDASQTWESKWLACVLVLGLLIRLGWGLSRATDDQALALLPDQRGYLDLARNLLRGNGLNYVDERFEQTVHAARTPGYPAFIALCGGSVQAVRAVQSIFDTSTALAIYLLARRITQNTRVGLFAAALVAFNPFLIYFSALLLTETLFTAMLAWAMLVLLSARGWIGGIIMMVLAIYVRPSGFALPVVLAGFAAYARDALRAAGSRQTSASSVEWRPGSLRRAVLATTLTAALMVAALFPWAWRNHRIVGRWIWLTSNDGITAYDGLHPGATGASDQSFVTQLPHVKEMRESQRSEFFAGEAKRFVKEHPAEAIRLAIAKICRTWSPVPLSDDFGRPLYRAIALLYALPFDALLIAGVFARRLPRAAIGFLLLPALYFTAVHAFSVGSLRYRVPAEPPLAVLAALGAMRVIRSRNEERG